MTLEILDYQSTDLGTLILRRRESLKRPGTMITEVTLDHEFLMSSYLTESERALTRIGLETVAANRSGKANSDDPISVLVGGLGLGYTAAEALSSENVASVEVVEYLPQVIGWLEDGLIPLAETLNAEKSPTHDQTDGRLNVSSGDIYARVTDDSDECFDLIAIDVDHSPQDVLGGQSHGFYTVPGLEATHRHLHPGGVLAVWSYDEDTPLLKNMSQVFSNVAVEEVTVWNDLIDEEQTDWLFFGSRAIA